MNKLLWSLIILLVGCAVTHKRGANVDAVIEVYSQNKVATEACYRLGLKEDSALQGKITLSWKVDTSGKAKNVQVVKSELANATVETCLLDHLNSISFPVQAKFSPALVEYEWNFSQQKSRKQ